VHGRGAARAGAAPRLGGVGLATSRTVEDSRRPGACLSAIGKQVPRWRPAGRGFEGVAGMTTKETRSLAAIAEALARKPFYGNTMGLASNLKPLVAHFAPAPLSEFDGKWCAAFVYHCAAVAGLGLPPRHPRPVSCSFAAVRGWLEWAKLPGNRFYHSARQSGFAPRRGDLVVFDRLFDPGPHDHMGVVLAADGGALRVAEGNVNNLSAVVRRPRNAHVRGYVRIPRGYTYVPAP